MKTKIVGLMPNENWFKSARRVFDVDGVAPALTSVGGGNKHYHWSTKR